jgi:hypothetical protein
MTPFASWVPAQTPLELSQTRRDTAAEFEALLSAIIDNLSLASACQLSQTLNAVSGQWVEKKSAEVLAELQTRVARVETSLTQSVTEALLPILDDAGLEKTISEFAATLRKLLPEFSRGDIRIAAPESLHHLLAETLQAEAVEASLTVSAEDVIHVASEAVEVTADLTAWAQTLRRRQAA